MELLETHVANANSFLLLSRKGNHVIKLHHQSAGIHRDELTLPDPEAAVVSSVSYTQAGSFRPSVSAHKNYSQQRRLAHAKNNTVQLWRDFHSPVTEGF